MYVSMYIYQDTSQKGPHKESEEERERTAAQRRRVEGERQQREEHVWRLVAEGIQPKSHRRREKLRERVRGVGGWNTESVQRDGGGGGER